MQALLMYDAQPYTQEPWAHDIAAIQTTFLSATVTACDEGHVLLVDGLPDLCFAAVPLGLWADQCFVRREGTKWREVTLNDGAVSGEQMLTPPIITADALELLHGLMEVETSVETTAAREAWSTEVAQRSLVLHRPGPWRDTKA